MTRFKNTRGPRSFGLVAVAAAVTAVVLVALNPLAGSQATIATQAAGPTLSETLGVFKTSRTSSDVLPSALERVALTNAGPEAELGESRRAFVMPEEVGVYLVPAGNRVCLLVSDLSLTPCYSLEAIAHGAAASSDICSPSIGANTIEIGGFVPDDASDPVIVFGNRRTQALKVTGNTYVERFSKQGPIPTEITWRSAKGPVTVSTSIPTGAASEPCIGSPSEAEALVKSGAIPAPLGHPPSHPEARVEQNGS